MNLISIIKMKTAIVALMAGINGGSIIKPNCPPVTPLSQMNYPNQIIIGGQICQTQLDVPSNTLSFIQQSLQSKRK